MKNILLLSIALLFSIASIAQEPRLFLSNSRIDSLQKAITVEGSHHARLFSKIKNRVDQKDLALYPDSPENYQRSWMALETALVYLITGEQKYATQAFNILKKIDTNKAGYEVEIPELGTSPEEADYDWQVENGSKAIGYVWAGMAYAICYDWIRHAWTQQQKDYIKNTVMKGLDDWAELFRWELYDMPASNWVSVCRGAEIVMMLGVKEEENRADRYKFIKDKLIEHYNLAYGPSGYGNEGLGYINYGVPFGYAALNAANDIGDKDLNSAFEDKEFGKLLMYAYSYTPERLAVQTSVDSRQPALEGLFGIVMSRMSEQELQYYKSFYDHHTGKKSNCSGLYRFDQRRFGAVWNFIYYPQKMDSVNPGSHYSSQHSDPEMGAYFFRNRWKNENDILFNINGKYKSHEHGWEVAETFNMSLLAFGKQYLGNAGKSMDKEKYTSLLVDNQFSFDNEDIGGHQFYEARQKGGYIILDGGEKYANLGIDNAQRHVLTQFVQDSSAVISTLDKLSDGSAHNYRYQLNVGDETGLNGITVTKGQENGHAYFVLKGNNQGFVKGWLMNHEGDFKGKDPLYFETEAAETNIWITMYVGSGNPPEGKFEGSGMSTTLNFSDQNISYDKSKSRITLENPLLTVSSKKQQNNLWLRPNPTDGQVHFITHQSARLMIFDQLGRKVLDKQYTAKGDHKINLSRKGLYIVKMKNKNGVKTEKLLVK